MVEAFNVEDLDVICQDEQEELNNNGIELLVNMDMVGGQGKAGKILNLIEYLARRGYLPYLLRAVRQARPGLI